MAYYWLPKRWRSKIESSIGLTKSERKFLDAGERINRYPIDFLKSLYGSGPRRGGAQIIKSGSVPGDPKRRSARIANQASGPGPVKWSNKRKGAPQRKTPAKKQKSNPKKKTTMPRRGKAYPYVGQGHYHGKFKAPFKRVKKVSYPVVQKTEHRDTETDADCVYLIHATHPAKYVLKTLAMTMVHKYFQQCNVHIRSFADPIGFYTAVGSFAKFNLRCVVVFQGKPEAAADPQFWTIADAQLAGVNTYEEFAIALADGLCGIYDNTTARHQPYITEVQWHCTGATGTTLQARNWDASEINIAISGKSLVNIQNRTAGGDVGASQETTSIYANPLHGKHYSIKGNGARIKHLGRDSTGTSVQLAVNQSNGCFSKGANDTDVGAQASDTLKQPPQGNYFHNCTKTGYIRLEPGSIKQSVCYAVVTKKLNRWLNDLKSLLETNSTLGALDNFQTFSMGETKMVALEKVADLGATNAVTIGFERDGIMRGRMWFSRKRFTAALNSLTL